MNDAQQLPRLSTLPMDLTAQQVQILVEVAFVAIKRNRLAEARRILGALKAFRPMGTYVAIGEALLEVAAGRPAEAAAGLERYTRQLGRRDAQVDCFHALALMMAGDLQGCLDQLSFVPPDADPQTLRFAEEILCELERRADPFQAAWHRLAGCQPVNFYHDTSY